MASRVAGQTLDELSRMKANYEALRTSITDGAGSLAALDHTLDNLTSANANIKDIKKSWNQASLPSSRSSSANLTISLDTRP